MIAEKQAKTSEKKNKQETAFNEQLKIIQESCRNTIAIIMAINQKDNAYSDSVINVFISMQAFVVNYKSALESGNPYFFELAKQKICDLTGAVYNSHINCPPKNQPKPKPVEIAQEQQQHAS
jgi:hypothetical protein